MVSTLQRPIGRTKLRVYPIGLGGMPMSLSGRPDESLSIEVIHAALDAGVNFIDTADSYCRDEKEYGHNERLIAKAIKSHPSGKFVTVATKGGYTRPRGSWVVDARPERLRKSCEASLRALGVDAITLYQLHHPDPRVPFADSVGALAKLKQEGKILHIGLSNVDEDQLKEAQSIVRIETVQNECNPFTAADFRNGVVSACLQQGVTYIAYSPVGGHGGHIRQARHAILGAIGRTHKVSPYQVALAWLMSKGPHVLPIPGASKMASIRDSALAAVLELTPEEIRQMDELGH